MFPPSPYEPRFRNPSRRRRPCRSRRRVRCGGEREAGGGARRHTLAGRPDLARRASGPLKSSGQAMARAFSPLRRCLARAHQRHRGAAPGHAAGRTSGRPEPDSVGEVDSCHRRSRVVSAVSRLDAAGSHGARWTAVAREERLASCGQARGGGRQRAVANGGSRGTEETRRKNHFDFRAGTLVAGGEFRPSPAAASCKTASGGRHQDAPARHSLSLRCLAGELRTPNSA